MCIAGPIGLANFSDEDLVVMYRSGTPQQREDAAGELSNRIRRIARAVVHSRPVGKQFKSDFVDDMPAEVLVKLVLVDVPGAFDPDKGRFFAWCWTVLGHRYQDLAHQWVRRYQRQGALPPGELRVDASASSHGEPDGSDSYPIGQGDEVQFSPQELALLEKMPKLQRVICVSAACWSPRVPTEVWQQWLAKARIQPPFPPAEISNFDRPTRRIPLLAEALGMKFRAVWQHWFRGRKSGPFREVSGGNDFEE